MTVADRLAADPALGALAVVVAGLVVAGVALAAWLVARALHARRRAARERAFACGHGARLAYALGDPAAERAWADAALRERADVVRPWLVAELAGASDAARSGVARVYRQLGFLDRDLALLGARRRRSRVEALRRVAGVATAADLPRLASLAAEGGELRVIVGHVTGRVGTAEDVIGLTRGWVVTNRLTEYPLRVMVSALATAELERLVGRWDELVSPALRRIVLSAAASRVPDACAATLPAAAGHPSMEVRIAACRAGGHVGGPLGRRLLLQLARDPTWEVRAQAATALGRAGGSGALDPLAEALGDPSFWVRQNAAAALVELGPVGVARLELVAEAGSDRYARDAAEHVLAARRCQLGAALASTPPVPAVA